MFSWVCLAHSWDKVDLKTDERGQVSQPRMGKQGGLALEMAEEGANPLLGPLLRVAGGCSSLNLRPFVLLNYCYHFSWLFL